MKVRRTLINNAGSHWVLVFFEIDADLYWPKMALLGARH
jgi:hypothetical protein